ARHAGHRPRLDAPARGGRQGALDHEAPQDGRAPPGHRHHRAQLAHPIFVATVLDATRAAVPGRLLPGPDPSRDHRRLTGGDREHPVCGGRHRRAAALHHPDQARLGDAGGGPEPDAGRRARHRRVAPGDDHLRAERRPHRRRRRPDRAGLSREVRHRRRPRPQGLLRGDHRRLQPDQRRAPRRPAGGRGGDAVGRLHLEPLPGRLRARDPHRGAAAQARGHLGREGGVGVVTLGAWARRGLALGAALALGVILPAILDQYKLYVLSLTLVYAILAIGLNLTLGYAGQISLCHAAFMAFGSYAVAILGQRGVPFEIGLVIGVTVAFAWGLVLGFPALKVKHHYLAMVTLGFNIIVFLVLRNWESLTGGSFGISNVARPAWGRLSFQPDRAYYFYILDRSIQFLMMVVRGGLGRFEGPFIGALVVTVLPEVLRGSEGLYLIIYALAVILMMLFMPKGLVGLWDLVWRSSRSATSPSTSSASPR